MFCMRIFSSQSNLVLILIMFFMIREKPCMVIKQNTLYKEQV